jgi:hypothetical protein
MAGCCENGNELSGSVKCWEILEQLRVWQLLKKDTALRCYVVNGLDFNVTRNSLGNKSVNMSVMGLKEIVDFLSVLLLSLLIPTTDLIEDTKIYIILSICLPTCAR